MGWLAEQDVVWGRCHWLAVCAGRGVGALPLASGVCGTVVWGRCHWLAVCAGRGVGALPLASGVCGTWCGGAAIG